MKKKGNKNAIPKSPPLERSIIAGGVRSRSRSRSSCSSPSSTMQQPQPQPQQLPPPLPPLSPHLVAWPSTGMNRSGLVIGWRNVIQQPQQQVQYWVVVAGILPIMIMSEESKLVTTTTKLQLKLVLSHLGTRSCFCCSGCNSKGNTRNVEDDGSCFHCSGCIRRICLENVIVLGYFSNSEEKEPSSTTTMPSSIPRFSLLETKQILLYEPNDTLYCHNNMILDHPFSGRMGGGGRMLPDSYVLLAQLTHARAVMDNVRNVWNSTVTSQQYCSDRVASNHTPRITTTIRSQQSNETNTLPKTTTTTTDTTSRHQSFTAITNNDDNTSSVMRNDHHYTSKKSTVDSAPWKSYSLLIHHCRSPFLHGWMARYEMFQYLWNILVSIPDPVHATGGGSSSSCCCCCCCDNCGKEQRWESHYESVTRQIQQTNRHLLVLIDSILGAVWASKLAWTILHFHHHKDNIHNNHHFNFSHRHLETSVWTLPWFLQTYESHYQFLFDGIGWLERFPIGLKLNERLTESVGREIERFWAIHKMTFQTLLLSSSSWRVIVPKFLGTGIILIVGLSFGATGLLALFHDVMRLATLHISVLAWFTHEVYRWELYLLAALWRLFRGKKRNILRQRTDTMEYDSMQLLLGTLLFAVSLFLFMTIFVYQVYFSALYLFTLALSVPFAFIRSAILLFPWAKVTVRWLAPGWLTKEVFLRESDDETVVDVTRLCCGPHSYASIVSSNLLPPITSLSSCLIAFIIQSLSGSIRMPIDER